MYILSHNSLEREQVQALTMYFIITTMAWSRCRRRLEREQEGGAQGPAERRHEGRVSQPARQRDLRAVERELRGERHGGCAQCSGRSVGERRKYGFVSSALTSLELVQLCRESGTPTCQGGCQCMPELALQVARTG